MIKKMILSTTLAMSLVHGYTDNTSSADNDLMMNETTKYAVWNPPLGKKESDKSCKDGKCIGNLNCMTKDGMVYKFFTSLRTKVKKQCSKL